MKKAYDLMNSCKLCVISTVNDQGLPESAVVGVSVHGENELTICTSRETRKFKNIQNNPKVSVVIGWDDKKTVQYEGIARELTGQEYIDRQEENFIKRPSAKRFKDDPDQTCLSISPTWIRFTDIARPPEEIEEKQFS